MPIKAQTFADQIIERLGVETDNSSSKDKSSDFVLSAHRRTVLFFLGVLGGVDYLKVCLSKR